MSINLKTYKNNFILFQTSTNHATHQFVNCTRCPAKIKTPHKAVFFLLDFQYFYEFESRWLKTARLLTVYELLKTNRLFYQTIKTSSFTRICSPHTVAITEMPPLIWVVNKTVFTHDFAQYFPIMYCR